MSQVTARSCGLATPTVLGGPLLTVEQTAERLVTSVRFVRRLVAQHRIAVIRVGRHVRIAPADLTAFLAAGRSEPLPRRP